MAIDCLIFATASNQKPPTAMTNLLSFLPFTPTTEQANALRSIESFLDSDDHFLIVRGAAGTGKTSIMSAVTQYLASKSIVPVPLGPTGRAAKNLGRKMGLPARTMHSCFYTPQTDVEQAVVRLIRRANDCTTLQVFIADESSMVSDRLDASGDFVAANPLLADFVDFVRQGHAQNKIIFVGDAYQLPPVGYGVHEEAPELLASHLQQRYRLRGSTVELSEIKRQANGSPILQVAHQLRQSMETRRLAMPNYIGQLYRGDQDAVRLYLERFEQGQHERVAILSLSNSYRDKCNALIRKELGLTGCLAMNDTVVLTQTHMGQHYVANGEVGVVKAVDSRRHRVADLEFVEAEIAFKDEHNKEFSILSLVLKNSLISKLTKEQLKGLYASEMRENKAFRESKDIRESRYLSALQLNYGHALTVHKAQGSEWDTVIMNTSMKTLDLRFLYTGITRARRELFTNGAHRYAA